MKPKDNENIVHNWRHDIHWISVLTNSVRTFFTPSRYVPCIDQIITKTFTFANTEADEKCVQMARPWYLDGCYGNDVFHKYTDNSCINVGHINRINIHVWCIFRAVHNEYYFTLSLIWFYVANISYKIMYYKKLPYYTYEK